MIDSRWVFVRKQELDSSIRHKAQLVVQGFKDHHQYDYSETYAPVAGLTDVRALLAIANKFDWSLVQMDVKTAFLNGELTKSVYMNIPDGVDKSKTFKSEKVCLLKQALYGLKVSPKRWYIRFKDFMEKLNFRVFDLQVCVFYWRKGTKIVILILYVDDIIITGNDSDKIRETK